MGASWYSLILRSANAVLNTTLAKLVLQDSLRNPSIASIHYSCIFDHVDLLIGAYRLYLHNERLHRTRGSHICGSTLQLYCGVAEHSGILLVYGVVPRQCVSHTTKELVSEIRVIVLAFGESDECRQAYPHPPNIHIQLHPTSFLL